MSIKTSPREVPLQATYNQTSTSLSNTPNSSSQHVFSDQMQTGNNTSFGSVDMLTQTKEESKSESGGSAQDDGQGGDNSMSTPLSLKGKNGATGPADGKSKPHICQICQRGFTTGGHLQRHQRIHTGVKAFRCPFPGCETRTSRQDNLQQHYRTHLSPSLRRGSGSQARAAVAAAMEAAGLKSTSSRQPRKSKSSAAGTPSSTTSAPNPAHLPSPYQTPTSNGPTHVPYPQYSYEPSPYGGYGHPIPPQGMGMPHPQSANSSRVPSPVNGHSSGHSSVGSMPGAAGHHPQPFFHAFSSPYTYMGSQQPYRYSTGPGGLPSPYSAGPPPGHPGGGPPPHAHHGIFPQNFNSEHNNHGPGGTSGPPHMYSPMQAGFGAPQHARESSYPGVMTPGYANQTPTMSGPNGYPPRTQTSTPLSQSSHHPHSHSHSNSLSHDDPRFPSPPGGSARRRTPPPTSSSIGAPVGGPDQSMLSQGVVDPSHMTTNRVLPSLINGSSGGPTFAGGGYGYQYNSWGSQNGSGAQHLASGGSGSGGNAGHSNGMAPIASGVMSAREMAHRASISSLSDGSINGASEGTAAKAARLNRLTAKIQ